MNWIIDCPPVYFDGQPVEVFLGNGDEAVSIPCFFPRASGSLEFAGWRGGCGVSEQRVVAWREIPVPVARR